MVLKLGVDEITYGESTESDRSPEKILSSCMIKSKLLNISGTQYSICKIIPTTQHVERIE